VSSESQLTINAWQNSTFGKPRRLSVIGKLHDEVSELMAAALSARRPKGKREAIAEELADLLIVAYQVAGAYQIDLLARVDDKMAVNRQRTWVLLGGGIGQHVESTEAQP